MSISALVSYQFTIDASIPEWLAQKELRTGAKKTVKAYGDALSDFRAFLGRGNLDLLDNPVDIARVAGIWANARKPGSHKAGEPVASATYNQRLAAVSSWFTFVQETYKLDIPNPMKDVQKRPVQAYATARYIEQEQVEQGLEDINREERAGLRNYALLAIGLATGRRASELIGLRGQDVKITGKGGRDQAIRIMLTFHCKGAKIMHDQLDPDVAAVFLEYLSSQFGQALLPGPDLPIWISYSRQNYGQAIGTQTLSDLCLKYFGTSKIHDLRHSFAWAMLKDKADLATLGGRLGHTNLIVTQKYGRELVSAENPHAAQVSKRFGIKRTHK